MPASIGAVLPGFGMQAGKPGAVGSQPQLLSASHAVVIWGEAEADQVVLETIRARFVGAHLLSPPVSNPG